MKTHGTLFSTSIACLLTLSACGGGGGGDEGTPPGGGGPDVTPDPSLVYAEGPITTRADYIGKTFPIAIITHDPDGATPLGRATGTVEYVDEDTARVTYNGTTTEYNLREGSSSVTNYASGNFSNTYGLLPDLILYAVNSSNPNAPSNVYGEATIKHTVSDPDRNEFSGIDHGIFGFSTPENKLTGSATYTTDHSTELLITTTSWIDENDDDTTFTRVDEVQSVTNDGLNIDVNFEDGTVSGSLFSGSYQTIDDRQFSANQVSHELDITLENGVVEGSGFTGDMVLATTPSSNPREPGAGPRPTLPSEVVINNQELDGYFFGHNAEGVGGSFEINFDETFYRGEENPFNGTPAEEVTENRTVVGVFVAEQ